MSDLLAMFPAPVLALAGLAILSLLAALLMARSPRDTVRLAERGKGLFAEGAEGRGNWTDWLATRLGLQAAAGDPELVLRLKRAGLYGRRAVLGYLVARVLVPLAAAGLGTAALMGMGRIQPSPQAMLLVVAGFGLAGRFAPAIYVQNLILRRQEAIRRNWADALDLLLLSVEAGLGIDAAFDEVARQMVRRAPELAREMRLTVGELSYLPDRKEALANLASRTEVPAINTVVTALIQAERYGTPVGTTLRMLTKDSRASRMAEAERRAAALPPRLTIPMIVFFMPVLFAVIFTPGIIFYLMDQ